MKKLCVFLAVVVLGIGPVFAGPPNNLPKPSQVKKELYITLSGVTLHSITQFISMYTGKPVLLPDPFPGDAPIDVISGEGVAVPADKAMSIFASVLRTAGYTIVDRASHIEIAPVGKADGLSVHGDPPSDGLTANAIFTSVVKIEHAEAAKLQTVLTSLKSAAGEIQVYSDLNSLVIKDHGVNVRSMLALLKKLDRKGNVSIVDRYKVLHSSTNTLLPVVKMYVTNLQKNADPLIKTRLGNFSVEANSATNSLILFGHTADVEKVKQYIATFDVRPDETSRTIHTYEVLNRDVAEMETILNTIIQKTGKPGESAVTATQVIADKAHNSLIIIAAPDKYRELLPVLKDLDKIQAQVEIESVLMEISTDKLLDIGIELNSTDGPGDRTRGFGGTTFGLSTITDEGKVPILPAAGGLTAGIFKDSAFKIAALIRASKTDEGISFIAAPRITALDNRPAKVKLSEEREFLKSIISPEGRTSEVTSGGFNKAEIVLEIIPHINKDGVVRLEITTQIDQFLPTTTTAEGDPLTNITKREAKTEVSVPDGQTVVIAGLTRTVKVKSVSKIPILGDIPFLGRLARRDIETDQERHLCIFITPHVHPTAKTMVAEAERRKQELMSLSKKHKGVDLPENLTGTETTAPEKEQTTTSPEN